MSKKDSGPAFPVEILVNASIDPLATNRPVQFAGMSLRDWFAGQALAGFCASPAANAANWNDSRVARCSYEVADAMLAAREKEPRDE